jgi:hypothetical protein
MESMQPLESFSLALTAMFNTVHNVGPTQVIFKLLFKKIGFLLSSLSTKTLHISLIPPMRATWTSTATLRDMEAINLCVAQNTWRHVKRDTNNPTEKGKMWINNISRYCEGG